MVVHKVGLLFFLFSFLQTCATLLLIIYVLINDSNSFPFDWLKIVTNNSPSWRTDNCCLVLKDCVWITALFNVDEMWWQTYIEQERKNLEKTCSFLATNLMGLLNDSESATDLHDVRWLWMETLWRKRVITVFQYFPEDSEQITKTQDRWFLGEVCSWG
jgi:hypothetical protein